MILQWRDSLSAKYIQVEQFYIVRWQLVWEKFF